MMLGYRARNREGNNMKERIRKRIRKGRLGILLVGVVVVVMVVRIRVK